VRLDKISGFTLENFRKHCREKGLADSTTNRILATYRRMGRQLHRWKVISAPLAMIVLPKEDNARDYVISNDEERRVE
jgi:hypothetical protein